MGVCWLIEWGGWCCWTMISLRKQRWWWTAATLGWREGEDESEKIMALLGRSLATDLCWFWMFELVAVVVLSQFVARSGRGWNGYWSFEWRICSINDTGADGDFGSTVINRKDGLQSIEFYNSSNNGNKILPLPERRITDGERRGGEEEAGLGFFGSGYRAVEERLEKGLRLGLHSFVFQFHFD